MADAALSDLPDDFFDSIPDAVTPEVTAPKAASKVVQAKVSSDLPDDFFNDLPDADPLAGMSVGDYAGNLWKNYAGRIVNNAAAIPNTAAIVGRASEYASRKAIGLKTVGGAKAGVDSEISDLEAFIVEQQPLAEKGDQVARMKLFAAQNRISNLRQQSSGLEERLQDLPESERVVHTTAELPALEPLGNTALMKAGEAIKDFGNKTIGAPDPRINGLPEMVAAGAGDLTATGFSAAAGFFIGGPAGAAAAGGAQGYSATADDIYRDAVAAGADDELATTSATVGGLIGVADVIPLLKGFQTLPASVRGKVTNAFLTFAIGAAKQGGKEGVTEGIQTVAQNLFEIGAFDADLKWSDGVTESMLVGAILGVGTHAVHRPRVEKLKDSAPTDEQKAALDANNGTPATPAAATPAPAPVTSPDLSVAAAMKEAVAKRKQAREQKAAVPAPAPAVVTPASNPPAPQLSEAAQAAATLTPAAPVATPEPTPAPAPAPTSAPTPAAPSEAAQAAAALTAQADPMTEQTVPEQPASVAEQRKALAGGTKAAVLYDAPKEGGKAPAKVRGEGIGRQKLPDGRIIDYDKTKLTPAAILEAFKAGNLNDVLELGPANKAQVAESVAAGAEPVVVTETTPEAVPVKEVASTDQLVPAVTAALEETKTAPENTIQTAAPEQVVADRVEAQPEPVAQPAEPAQKSARPAAGGITKNGNRVPTPDELSQVEQAISRFKELASQVKQSEWQRDLRMAVEQAEEHLAALRQGDPDIVEDAMSKNKGPRYARFFMYPGFRELSPEAGELTDVGASIDDMIDGMISPRPSGSTPSEAAQAAAALPKIEQTQQTDSYTAVAPKKAAVVEVAKRRAIPKKPMPPKVATAVTRASDTKPASRIETKAEEKPKGRILRVEDPEIEAQYKAAEEEQDARIKADKKAEKKPERDFVKSEKHYDLRERLKRGELSAADEAEERLRISSRANTQGVAKAIVQAARRQAEIVRAVFDESRPEKLKVVNTKGELIQLRDRLKKAVSDIQTQLAAEVPEGLSDSVKEKVERRLRLPESVDSSTADIIVWAKDAELLLKQLNAAIGKGTRAPRITEDLETAIRDYLIDEQLVAKGDGEPLRARRKEMGDLAMRQQQGGVEDIGDMSSDEMADEEGRVSEVDENDSDGDRPASVTARAMRLRAKDAKVGAEKALDPKDILETTSLGEAIGRIGEVKPRRFPWQTQNIVQKVMGRVRAKIGDLKVHIVSQDAIDAMFPDKEPGSVQGFYRIEQDDIVVTEASIGLDGNIDWQLLTHEAVHALVEDGVASSENLRAQFTELYGYVRENIDEDQRGAYAFEDIHEFIAEALSNPEFQAALQETAIPDAMARKFGLADNAKTVWGAIVAAVRRYVFNDKSIEKIPGKDFDAMSAVLQFAEAFETTGQGSKSGVRLTVRSIEDRLKASGLDERYVKDAADLLRSELGTVTQADIDEIVQAVKAANPVVTPPSNPGARRGKVNAKVNAEVEKLQKQAQQAQVQANTFVPKADPGAVRGMSWKANNFVAKQSERFFGTENNPVTKITRLMENRRTTRARIVREMAPSVQKLAELRAALMKTEKGRKTWNEFGNFINDVTSAQVHPDVPLTDPRNAHLGKKAMKGVWGKAQHPDLAKRYAALPADLRDAYASTRDLFTEAQNKMNLGLVRNILVKTGHTDPSLAKRFFDGTETEADRKLVGPAVAEMIADAEELKAIKGPYFPLMRRGNFVVTGRYKVNPPTGSSATKISDNAYEFRSRKEAEAYAQKQDTNTTVTSRWVDKTTGKPFAMDNGKEVRISKNDVDAEQRFVVAVQDQHVEFFDSEKEADRAKADFEKQGMLDVSGVQNVRQDPARASADMTAQRLDMLSGTLDKRLATSKLSPSQQAELKGALFEASLRMLGSTRIQSRRLPRRNVSGASTDIVQNAAEYALSTAGYLAKLEHAPAMEAALKQLDVDTSRLAKTGRSELSKGATVIRNEMTKRANSESYLEANGELDSVIRRITSFNFLTKLASPAYSFINAQQPLLLTVPHLAGEYGEFRAVAQIAKAYRDIGAAQIAGQSVVETAKDVAGKGREGGYIDDIKGRLKDKTEHALLDRLVEDGAIDPDAGFEISSLARQRKGVGSKIDTGLEYLSSIARQAPQAVEDINRTVTALAAHRLEMKRSGDSEKAYRAAWDAVAMTQGIMSNTNSAPVFNTRPGRLALQFKKFSAMTYGAMGYQLGRAIKPMEAGDRAKAIKSLAYMAATHAAFAGVMGIPGMEAAKIALWLFGMLGLTDMGWEEFKAEVEKALAAITGETVAKGVTRGVTSALPGDFDFDLSRRMGADNLALDSGPLNGTDTWSWVLGQALGVSASTGRDVVAGANAAMDGDFSDLKRLIPLKMISDGITASEKLERGDYSTQEFVLRTLGLSPTEELDVSRETGAQIRASAKAKDERNGLISSYINASNAGEAAQVLSQIRAYNRKAGNRDIGMNWIKEQRRDERAKWQN